MERLVLLAQLWILQLLNYLSFFEERPKCKNWSCMGATLSHFLGAVLVFSQQDQQLGSLALPVWVEDNPF